MKKQTWVIVANSSLARIFKREKDGKLLEIEGLVHPDSRKHATELVSDKPGRAFDRFGGGRHAMESEVMPQEQQFIDFSKEIAEKLHHAFTEGQLERLYIAAAPAFLGLLRQAMNGQVKQIISGEINKDLTHMQPDEIKKQFLEKVTI